MRARPLFLTAAAVAAALSVAAVAGAQDRAAPDGRGGPMTGQMREHMRQRMGDRQDRMIADVRAILRLRPDQEAAFKALTDSLHPPGLPGEGAQPPGPPTEDMTTPQMLDRMARMEARMHDEMQKRQGAILAFYNVLSPDQQKAFDALVRLHAGFVGGGMMMRHEGGPGMGGGRRIMMLHMGGPGGPDGDPPPPPGGE